MNVRDTATMESTEAEHEAAAEGGTSPATVTGDPLSKDLIFDLLRNWRRRQVLRYLDGADGSARLDELAEHIAAKENDISIQALSSSERKRVYIALYQCHLPKMDDSGVIDYNQARGTVSLRNRAARLYPYLFLDPTDQDDGDGLIDTLRSKFMRSDSV